MNTRKIGMVIIVLILVVLNTACGNDQNLKSIKTTNSPDTQSYNDAIYKLQESITATYELYYKEILSNKDQISNESIKSIQGLIEVKTKVTSDNYAKLSTLIGDKQDQVIVLKKAVDKLELMN